MHLFDTLLVQPIINVLVVFYHIVSFVHIPYALGFSIILMTIFVRLLLYPLTASQLKISKKMQDLAPHLSNIKEKHKGDLKKQQEATMALYKEHNVNPAAGCLPSLVQIVILLFGLYPALQKIIALNPKETVSVVNHMVYFPSLQLVQPWDTHFLGLALVKTPGQLITTVGPIVLLIPLLTGVLQLIQSKMMMSSQAPAIVKKGKEEDFATTFQKQSLYLLPVMIGFFSYNFSIGLSLYWNTFTIFGIIQQYLIAGLGGLEAWVNAIKKKK
ncbi:MAG TPA: YidC/Oxa1 family membrane protein insertase [Methylomirabilota bacterium]|nr:YidC/Oxa1 family membrane protein insertase [Methylomirabilota bacterium]